MFKYFAIAIVVALFVGVKKFLTKREYNQYKRAQHLRNERAAKQASDNWLKASAQDTRTVKIRRGFDAPDYTSYMSDKK